MALQVLLDSIIAYTQDQIVVAEAVSGQVLDKEDFAFVVDASVAAGDLVALVRRAGGSLVEDARVFDVFAGAQVGEGLKSVAVNVRMRGGPHADGRGIAGRAQGRDRGCGERVGCEPEVGKEVVSPVNSDPIESG